MPSPSEFYDLERQGVRFLRALRRGDAAALADLWHEAESAPELEAFFEELLDEEGADGERLDEEAVSSLASLPEEKPLTPAGRLPLPPLPTVIVRHRSRAAEEGLRRVHARHPEEPQCDAGFIEKA